MYACTYVLLCRYVDLFWFVPEGKLTQCFVTPAALTRAVERMYEERGRECGATLLVLKMIYIANPHLELQLLQVIHFRCVREARSRACVCVCVF